MSRALERVMYVGVPYPRVWAVAKQDAGRRQGWWPWQGPQRRVAAAQARGKVLQRA
jgi:hypothetical protein